MYINIEKNMPKFLLSFLCFESFSRSPFQLSMVPINLRKVFFHAATKPSYFTV